MLGYWSTKYPDYTQRMAAIAKQVQYRELRGIVPHHAATPLELVPKH